MILNLEIEQPDMDAFSRILDAACRGAGVAIAPDVVAWLARMQAAITEAQKETVDG